MFEVRRIKHITIIVNDRDAATSRLRQIFDFGEAHPGVMARFGLINDHFPIGDSFVEVLQVTDPARAGGAFLARFGEGFYMLIFEIRDQPAALAHVEAMGARVSLHSEGEQYRNIHLHPSTNLGPLLGVGDPVGPNPWQPGGPDWQQHARKTVVQMLREAALVTDDLDRMAGRYQRYFGFTPERYERLPDGGYSTWIPLGDTVLQLIQPGAGSESDAAQHLARKGPGIFEVRLQVQNLAAALERARAAGVGATAERRIGAARAALLEPGDMFGARWQLVEQPGEWPRRGLEERGDA